MSLGSGTLYGLVIGGEVAFWVALACGFTFRYLLQRPLASRFFLWCVPAIDLALLALTVLDLRGGATATFAHGLAAAYVGFSVVFGPSMIRWADQRFAHWFGGGPAPLGPASGWASVLHELRLWIQCLLAAGLTALLLLALIALVDRPEQTQALHHWFRILPGTVFFWLVFGPLWSLVFFRRAPATMRGLDG